MNDKKQSPSLVVADDRIPGLVPASSIHQAQKRIKEDFRGSFEWHAMLEQIRCRLCDIPSKRCAVEFEANIRLVWQHDATCVLLMSIHHRVNQRIIFAANPWYGGFSSQKPEKRA